MSDAGVLHLVELRIGKYEKLFRGLQQYIKPLMAQLQTKKADVVEAPTPMSAAHGA